MWELDRKESWEPKNWCFWTVVLQKTVKSPLDCKEIQPVHPKGDQPWRFTEGLMLNWSFNALATWYEELTHWKRPWWWGRLKAGGEADNRMKWLYGITDLMDWASGVGDRQGSLACCSPWAAKVGHAWATVLNGTDIHYNSFRCITQWFSYLICCEMITKSLVNIVITPKFFL